MQRRALHFGGAARDCKLKFHAKVASLIWRSLCQTKRVMSGQVPKPDSIGRTWAPDDPHDVQHALLAQLYASTFRGVHPKFFQLVHQAMHGGIRNRLPQHK